MLEQQIIVLTGNSLIFFGIAVGFGAVIGAAGAIGLADACGKLMRKMAPLFRKRT